MKKFLGILVLFFLIGNVFAINELSKPPTFRKTTYEKTHNVIVPRRNVPEYNISIAPTDIMTTFYDYMIGSFNSIPIRLQSDEYGGIYLAFHAKETSKATRRVYYAYIDNYGNLLSSYTISPQDGQTGYCGMDIDPITGDPFYIYQKNTDGVYKDMLVYDMFSIMESPGLLVAPNRIIDNTDYPDNKYLFPYIFVGQSPIENKRRLYVYVNDNNENDSIDDNTLFGYADFSESDLDSGQQFDFTLYTLPHFDVLHPTGKNERRFKSMAVSNDGKVAFIGYSISKDTTPLSANNEFVIINDNYGEAGCWTYHEFNSRQMVENPVNADGSPFTSPDGTIPFGGQLWLDWYYSNNFNSFFDDDGKLWFAGNQFLQQRISGETIDRVYPYYGNVKAMCYNPNNNNFEISDIYPKSQGNGHFVPWDIDGDGIANVYSSGYLETVEDWPIYYWKNDLAFYDNNTKIIVDGDLKVCVWQDGLKNKYYNENGNPYYSDWETVPEIYISLRKKFSETWTDPICLNSINTPELSGIIPEYVYPADGLKNIHVDNNGNTWGTLYLMFLNDSAFGSSIHQLSNIEDGIDNGGTIQYMAIDLNFGGPAQNNKNRNNSIVSVKLLEENYPNPFNPTTTIAFNMPKTGNANLSIYNIKGQLIKTLVNGKVEKGQRQVIWTGIDNNNMKVSSGVYFYKLIVGNHSEIKRMLLLK